MVLKGRLLKCGLDEKGKPIYQYIISLYTCLPFHLPGKVKASPAAHVLALLLSVCPVLPWGLLFFPSQSPFSAGHRVFVPSWLLLPPNICLVLQVREKARDAGGFIH